MQLYLINKNKMVKLIKKLFHITNKQEKTCLIESYDKIVKKCNELADSHNDGEYKTKHHFDKTCPNCDKDTDTVNKISHVK